MSKVKNPVGNPNIAEAGKKTQITPETANEYRIKGLAIRRHLTEQKKVWETPADLPKEQAEFFAMFGFVGPRQKLIDNKYKFAYKALKKAYDKGDLNNIIKFFQMLGLDWAADAAQFIAAFNATINKPEETDKNEPVEFVITRVGGNAENTN